MTYAEFVTKYQFQGITPELIDRERPRWKNRQRTKEALGVEPKGSGPFPDPFGGEVANDYNSLTDYPITKWENVVGNYHE